MANFFSLISAIVKLWSNEVWVGNQAQQSVEGQNVHAEAELEGRESWLQ